jgi:hypothetical protein
VPPFSAHADTLVDDETEERVIAHPLLKLKRAWKLVHAKGGKEHTLIVQKKQRFSLQDAHFALAVFSKELELSGPRLRVMLMHTQVCYKASALLRLSGIELLFPGSNHPARADTVSNPQVTRSNAKRRAVDEWRKSGNPFDIVAPFEASRLQQKAVSTIVEGVLKHRKQFQTLMGATGTGKVCF